MAAPQVRHRPHPRRRQPQPRLAPGCGQPLLPAHVVQQLQGCRDAPARGVRPRRRRGDRARQRRVPHRRHPGRRDQQARALAHQEAGHAGGQFRRREPACRCRARLSRGLHQDPRAGERREGSALRVRRRRFVRAGRPGPRHPGSRPVRQRVGEQCQLRLQELGGGAQAGQRPRIQRADQRPFRRRERQLQVRPARALARPRLQLGRAGSAFGPVHRSGRLDQERARPSQRHAGASARRRCVRTGPRTAANTPRAARS